MNNHIDGDFIADEHISYEPFENGAIQHIDNIADEASNVFLQHGDDTSQLTLSFRGQVYFFDDVAPEKVQSVLLMLGSSERSSGAYGVDISYQNHNGMSEFPGRCSHPQRAASLNRFRQKRKERCFDKKIRYNVRQEVALRMNRKKGQFTSKSEEPSSYSWDDVPESLQVSVESFCSHCGTESHLTPMMRRGPAGPRSLCNACGLYWVNKGTLKDLPKKKLVLPPMPNEQEERVHNEFFHDMNTNCAIFSNGDNKDFVARQ